MKRFLFVAVVVVANALVAANAQAQQHRFGSWNALAVTHDLNKKWSANADVMARLYPSAYNSQYIAEAGISRELGKRFEAGVGYRYTLKDVGHEQRVQFDLAGNIRKKGFQLTDRVRYQYEWNEQLQHANYLRNKTTLKYRKLKKLTPLVAFELFYHADYGFQFVDQLRLFAGADYKLTKRVDLGLQWIRTHEVQVKNPLTSDIFYAGLTYDFQRDKKKESKKRPSDF